MMNDERAIYLLKSILPKKVSYAQMICASNCYGDEMVYQEPEPYAVEYGIKAIEENAKLKSENSKLKAEIEQLELSGDSVETSSIKYYNLYKKSLDQIARLKEQVEVKDNNFELYCDLVDENERLYAELGKLGWKDE